LNAKRFDFVATSVTITPERAKNYAFTIPVDEATTYAIKRKSNKSINSIEDVNGKVGGTQLGSGTERSVRLWDKSQKDAGRKGLSELKLYSTYPEMYLGVANGEIDVGFHTLTALNSLMKNKPDTYTLIDRVSDQTYYSWLTRPEDASLRDFLNAHIKELIVSGKMAELQQKWFGKSTKLPLEGYLPPGAH
jgi:polar amino acid transport system substrate-binding protein